MTINCPYCLGIWHSSSYMRLLYHEFLEKVALLFSCWSIDLNFLILILLVEFSRSWSVGGRAIALPKVVISVSSKAGNSLVYNRYNILLYSKKSKMYVSRSLYTIRVTFCSVCFILFYYWFQPS